MKKQNLLQKIFPKQIPSEIKQDINKAIDILLKEEPRILEIRLFGSYSKGNFTARSDIDLGIFINAPEYFYDVYNPDPGDECSGNGKFTSSELGKLRDIIGNKLGNHKKWSPHIFTQNDWPYFDWEYGGRKRFIQQEVLRGILLYHHSLPREETRL